MSAPQYIGAATPHETVEVRLGRFSRYSTEGAFPQGAGHQPWDEVNYPCLARVGSPEGPKKNANYTKPWQALWIPTTAYATIPNVLSVKLDKKLEIGGVGTATIEIENITYPRVGPGVDPEPNPLAYHVRERGTMSPLRGIYAHGDPGAPDMEPLKGEWGEIIAASEWQGRFAFSAQLKIHQGYGTANAKTFTGLIEDVDTTSHPDKIILTARDFGLAFTDEHFFGWNKDPVINTPVTFIDRLQAASQTEVAYNANSSNEELPAHPASKVLDSADPSQWWQTNLVHSALQTEYVEVALPEGTYTFADVIAKWPGMEVYVALRAAETKAGAPTRNGEPMTIENKWLDGEGWVDLTKAEGQIVPGVNGGNSYTNLYESYPSGHQRTPIDPTEAAFHVGRNSVLRLSFRKLHPEGGGENYRAGLIELNSIREELLPEAAKQEWVTVDDIADVVRIICQWAGFKEWDIPNTGTRLPKRLLANPAEAYLDIIKKLAEGIGYVFFMADPSPDTGGPLDTALGGSLGIPTFRKSQVTENDYEGIPVITDRSLLTAINVKQSNAALAYVIRVYGRTLSLPGDMELSIERGKRLVYTFRPPWTGSKPTYADSRLGGVLTQVLHTDPLFSTPEQVRNAAWFIALQEALASIEATIEFPAYPGLDIDDHALLMDLGTGITTRIAVHTRSSTFVDGEKRKWTMQVTGPLIDTVDVRDMVNIINEAAGPLGYSVKANGIGTEWGDPRESSGSSLGYG